MVFLLLRAFSPQKKRTFARGRRDGAVRSTGEARRWNFPSVGDKKAMVQFAICNERPATWQRIAGFQIGRKGTGETGENYNRLTVNDLWNLVAGRHESGISRLYFSTTLAMKSKRVFLHLLMLGAAAGLFVATAVAQLSGN